jgi:hypothetical protein
LFLNAAVLAAVLITMAVLAAPRLYRWRPWRAMITPLASIIGSGFLVLGPILNAAYGVYAPLAMAGLCAVAYLFGSSIRFNIAAIEASPETRGRPVDWLETAASWSLTFAYVISVTYYLNLFGAFALSLTPFNDPFYARALTSLVFLLIAFVGWWKGFSALERMEYGSVVVKLAIIAGVLTGLAVFFFGRWQQAALVFNPPEKTGLSALTLAFGLLITVQGFETSRYLGETYKARTRILSMELAQWLSSGIYMIYAALLAYVFARDELRLTETAIIDMMKVVAPVLPPLLVAAALAAQFSAAIADTSGSGGLVHELTKGRIKPRVAYVLLAAIGLLITWAADIFQIISYASRAFAVYYAFQALIAALTARENKTPVWKTATFFALFLLAVAISLFGQSVEG